MIVRLALLLLTTAFLAGCAAFAAASAIGSTIEREKKIEVLAKYDGLRDKTVAVLVNADLSTLYQHPALTTNVVTNITNRIGRALKDQNVRVMRPVDVLNWQYGAATWSSMPYGQIAAELGVERVILIDIYEYRLNPPGNRWVWEGVCAANVGIIEGDGLDPDMLVDEFTVMATFPPMKNLAVDSANAQQIETGLLANFYEQVEWLFYDHEEYKYPAEMRL